METQKQSIERRHVRITHTRLWFFYVIADLHEEHIHELTGWSPAAIKKGIERWKFSQRSAFACFPYSWTWAVRRLVVERVGVRLDGDEDTAYNYFRSDMRWWITRAIEKNEFPWAKIDKLKGWIPASLEYRVLDSDEIRR